MRRQDRRGLRVPRHAQGHALRRAEGLPPAAPRNGRRMSASNRRWRVAAIPSEQLASSHFDLETADRPEVPDGQVLCRVLWISIDAAQRAWFQGDTYRSAIQIGD